MSPSTAARLLSIPAGLKEPKPEGCASTTSVSSRAPEDEVLMSRVQSGDPEALGHLFDRYSRLVLWIGLRILRDTAEAEDLVQDVFLYVYTRSRVFDQAKGSARSWLVQVSYHRALDRRRYLNARFFYDRTSPRNSDARVERAAECRAEGLGELLYWESYLRRAFEELSEDQRKILKLHFFEGYTLLEISEKLGQSLGNIRHYYYRGLEHLRKQIFNGTCRSKQLYDQCSFRSERQGGRGIDPA